MITVLEGILLASQQSKIEKLPTLEKTSVKLNFLKVCVRLMKDVKAITPKTYIVIEANLDEIGKMLGGWIKSTKSHDRILTENPTFIGGTFCLDRVMTAWQTRDRYCHSGCRRSSC